MMGGEFLFPQICRSLKAFVFCSEDCLVMVPFAEPSVEGTLPISFYPRVLLDTSCQEWGSKEVGECCLQAQLECKRISSFCVLSHMWFTNARVS